MRLSRVLSLRDQVDPQDSATIHQVRVAFKKFRYLVELLQPVLPRITVRQIEAMQDYQSLMGEIQDVETLQEALDEFVLRKKSHLGKYLNFRDYLRKRRDALVQSYLHQAGRLNTFWPPRSPRISGSQRKRTTFALQTFQPLAIADN
jgi:CHAD domain-containing protein